MQKLLVLLGAICLSVMGTLALLGDGFLPPPSDPPPPDMPQDSTWEWCQEHPNVSCDLLYDNLDYDPLTIQEIIDSIQARDGDDDPEDYSWIQPGWINGGTIIVPRPYVTQNYPNDIDVWVLCMPNCLMVLLGNMEQSDGSWLSLFDICFDANQNGECDVGGTENGMDYSETTYSLGFARGEDPMLLGDIYYYVVDQNFDEHFYEPPPLPFDEFDGDN